MNRSELVKAVAERAGSDESAARRHVDAVFDTVQTIGASTTLTIECSAGGAGNLQVDQVQLVAEPVGSIQ